MTLRIDLDALRARMAARRQRGVPVLARQPHGSPRRLAGLARVLPFRGLKLSVNVKVPTTDDQDPDPSS